MNFDQVSELLVFLFESLVEVVKYVDEQQGGESKAEDANEDDDEGKRAHSVPLMNGGENSGIEVISAHVWPRHQRPAVLLRAAFSLSGLPGGYGEKRVGVRLTEEYRTLPLLSLGGLPDSIVCLVGAYPITVMHEWWVISARRMTRYQD